MSKLGEFLPKLQAANEVLQNQLKEQPASNFDVENVPEDQEGGYIEMVRRQTGLIAHATWLG